eukprot:6229495-Pyramimonas_sp.AAC.1
MMHHLDGRAGQVVAATRTLIVWYLVRARRVDECSDLSIGVWIAVSSITTALIQPYYFKSNLSAATKISWSKMGIGFGDLYT